VVVTVRDYSRIVLGKGDFSALIHVHRSKARFVSVTVFNAGGVCLVFEIS
jgi:hypothetical protein